MIDGIAWCVSVGEEYTKNLGKRRGEREQQRGVNWSGEKILEHLFILPRTSGFGDLGAKTP